MKLIECNVNGKVIRVIYNLYEKAKSGIKQGSRISQFFTCKSGVRQGENLSPLLFAIYLNDFERFLSRKYRGLNSLANDIRLLLSDDDVEIYLRLYALLYADDTIIMAESEEELQAALEALENYCKLWDLTVNLDKTKIIIFSRGMVKKHKKFVYEGKEVEVVHDYVYLGVNFHYNNSFVKGIDKQLTLGKKALFSMLTKIESLNLPLDLQFNLFDQLVVPVLTYGCEVWGYTNIHKLELFYRKFLKSAMKVSKYTASPI